jgi:6-phospho-3-hexuloisomerase
MDPEKFREGLEVIHSSVEKVLSRIDEKETAQFIQSISSSRRLFLSGQGRSGLVARCFAMRLMHLGFSSYVVGETTTPGIGKKDLLIICSCSGRKHITLELVRQARQSEAAVFALTASRESPLVRLVHRLIFFPLVSQKDAPEELLGSLFEQSLFLYLEGVVLFLMRKMKISEQDMLRRHTNLE